MCEIKAKIMMDGHPLVVCTKSDDDFMRAQSIRLFNKTGDAVDVTRFVIEKTKQCFNNNPISPVFRIDENVSGDFLEIGNRVEFSFQRVAVNKPSRPTAKPVRPPLPKRRELAFA